jgi:hypothetical protein
MNIDKLLTFGIESNNRDGFNFKNDDYLEFGTVIHVRRNSLMGHIMPTKMPEVLETIVEEESESNK